MHVQSLSHWAPANIGPYSQSQLVSECSLSPAADSDADSDADVDEDSNETARWERLYVSGQIGMVPANLCLITSASGTGRAPTMAALAIECRLALRHLRRVMQASRGFEDAHLCHVLFYVTRAELVPIARLELEHMFALDSRLPTRPVSGGVCTGSERTSNALVQWALVPALPKGAHFEVEAHAVRYDAGAALTDATHRVLFGFETHAIHSRTSEFTAELYTCAVADRLLVARLSVLTPTATQPQGIDSETIAAAISEALLPLLRSCAGGFTSTYFIDKLFFLIVSELRIYAEQVPTRERRPRGGRSLGGCSTRRERRRSSSWSSVSGAPAPTRSGCSSRSCQCPWRSTSSSRGFSSRCSLSLELFVV